MKSFNPLNKRLRDCAKLAFVALLTFSFFSCKNFFVGELIQADLQEALSYANAPAFIVRVEADEGTGTMVTGGGDNSLKVTDNLIVKFSKAKGYKFIEWRAIQKDNQSVSMDDYVLFGDRTALETTITLAKTPDEDILIKPYCEEVLYLKDSTYPKYTDEGAARDSSISLVFSSDISNKNDFSKITITLEGSNTDVSAHFEAPELSENNLVFVAKTDNRIAIGQNDTKTIVVTIPDDFIYLGKKGEEVITGEELVYKYKINASTSGKIHITFKNDNEDAGVLKVNGTVAPAEVQTYSIGQEVTVSYKINDGYVFKDWVSSVDGVLFIQRPDTTENPNYDEKGFNSEEQTATAILKIINQAEAVVFASQTAAIPFADIKGVSDETGTYSYDINKEYLEGRGGNLGFNTSSDYQFIRWMVWDAKANNGKGEEITNGTYITVKEPKNANTAFELVKAPANTVELWIKPLCVKRPKVVSSTPTYDSNGVYRDRRIIVMFNKQMSESSIYYTNDEVSKLKQEGKKLLETSENSGIYYGYWDGSDYNTYVFKNITITKRNDADVNLLKYYEAPYFDEKDKSVLRIDTKRGNEAPLGATDILVTINSPMACEIDSNMISLSGNYEWAYYTNGKIDTDAPYFTDSGVNKFSAHFDIDDQKNADNTAKSIETERTVFDNRIPENYKNNYLRSKTLWIKGAFEDGGSGPNYLKWELYKVKSDYYPMEAEEKLIGNGQIDELRVAPTIAIIERKLDDGSTSDETFVTLPLTDEDEGLFRIDFICADKNARTSDPASFYFVYDKVGQSRFKKELISNSRPNEREETVSWRNPDDFDYDSVIVECWNGNRKIGESVYPDSNVLSHKFTNLENQKKYDYRFYTKDIYGNTSKNYYTYNDTTAPSVLTGVYTGVRNGIVDVYLNTPNNEDFDHIEYAESTSPNNFSDLDFSKNSTPNIHNLRRSVHIKKTFKNASAGKQYGYWLRTVDYSGNASNAILVQEVGGVTAGDICYWTAQDGLFCSEHYYSDKEVVGIVALTEANDSITKILTPKYDQNKYLVYTTGYKESYPQGKNGAGNLPTTNEDGYPTYKAIINNPAALAQAPIFGYLKNTYNINEKVTWYLPAINELLLIKYGTISASYSTNKCAVDDTYAFLNTKGKSNISSFSNPEPSYMDGEIVTSSVYFDHGNLTNFTIYFKNWYNKVWDTFPRASHQDLKTRSLYMARVDMSDTDNPKKWDATEE